MSLFLFPAYVTFVPLQPCNHDGSDEDDGDQSYEGFNAEDKVVFTSSDEEEDDGWFDQLVERKLSEVSEPAGSEVSPTELEEDSQLVMDSQVLDPDDFLASQAEPMEPLEEQWQDSQTDDSPRPLKLDEKGVSPSPRPVARPLQASKDVLAKVDKNIINLDEDEDGENASEAARRARRIAVLKAQIAALESMQGELQGPRFFHVFPIMMTLINVQDVFNMIL